MDLIFICFSVFLCIAGANGISVEEKEGPPDEWGHDFQGDIKLSKTSRNGLRNEKFRWPNGVVPFVFGDRFPYSKKYVVYRAIDHYKKITNGCIQFKERTTEPDFVVFVDFDEGCYSFIGRQGGRQFINLPTWCSNSFGSVLHEMYHALGFLHEQSRSDRDNYVEIRLENADEDSKKNFATYGPEMLNDFSTEYDYGSIMHYSPKAFSINGKRTIITKDIRYANVIGQRNDLSSNDLYKLLKMYKCI